jgi:hypothetical protein
MDGASATYYDVPKSLVQPYFDVATNYGFANYMFETGEGPSFPAHQFIFGGSSAPEFPGDQYYQYFVAENPVATITAGCLATDGFPLWVDPDDSNEFQNQIGCYDRNTLVTYQDSTGKVYDWTDTWPSLPYPTWKYYVPIDNKTDPLAGIWNAPADDPQVCYFSSSGGGTACDSAPSSEYQKHVSVAKNSNMMSAPILTDIGNCQLPAISWVIPDERWSDHPGNLDMGLGPDWVANIVDAIGQSAQNSGGVCDYWGTSTTAQRIEPTVILIVWDDWGGFYDHVPPPAVYRGNANDDCTTLQAPNAWGCGYVYGFRVPLLVVSEYTPAAYVSGACGPGTQNSCPDLGPQSNPYLYAHDFGSILAFTENNFYQQNLYLQYIYEPLYADYNALDATYQLKPAIPLWDFFLNYPSKRPFTRIAPINAQDTVSFFESFYQTMQANGTYPTPLGPEEIAPGVDDPED